MLNNLFFLEPPRVNYSSRRKSVFAEAYDPEEDEDDGEKVTILCKIK